MAVSKPRLAMSVLAIKYILLYALTVGTIVELLFPPPNEHGWERGIFRLVAQGARCFYMYAAYAGHSDDKVDVDRSRWRRVRKKKCKTLKIVGTVTATPRSDYE